jgi:phosphatidylglycerol---prolipoprotein diacylglyceryl transferase
LYPFIYFQDYKLSVYFITLAVVYCIGIQYYFMRLKKFKAKSSVAADFLLVLMIFGFIGARIFYVLYQEPDFYFKNPKEILSVWNGGFIYYGGFLLGLFSGLVFLKLRKQSLLLWLDISAPVAAMSYGLGRLACFFNGCCYGAETTLWFGIKFPHLHGLRHPTQLYAVFYELLVWILLLVLERKVSVIKNNVGSLFFAWLFLHGLGRLIMEHFRADPRGHLIFGFTVSSTISLALILISIIYLIRCQVPNPGHTASNKIPIYF